MPCPYCDSTEIVQSHAFDGTYVDAGECLHDFECQACEGWFQIRFAPIATEPYKTLEEQEADL